MGNQHGRTFSTTTRTPRPWDIQQHRKIFMEGQKNNISSFRFYNRLPRSFAKVTLKNYQFESGSPKENYSDQLLKDIRCFNSSYSTAYHVLPETHFYHGWTKKFSFVFSVIIIKNDGENDGTRECTVQVVRLPPPLRQRAHVFPPIATTNKL
jgi:hypothetical protein